MCDNSTGEPVNILSNLFGLRKDHARTEAIRLGIAIDEVTRDCPFFNINNSQVSLEAASCIKYTVQRQPGGVPSGWSFLQRTRNEGVQYPHGWLFVSPHDPPSAELERVLAKIASEWDGELLEFEATSSEVSAFWAEWGGRKIVTTIHGYLRELAQV
jgi:hypothetical protein